MNPRDYDPPEPLAYLELIKTIARAYREVTSPENLVARLGAERLTDITNVPEIMFIEAATGPPPGFEQHVYQFCDARFGRGNFDVAFHGSELVNARMQLCFQGWFGKRTARKYLHDALVPLFWESFGPPSGESADTWVFKLNGLIGVARYVHGTKTISSWLTEERFA